MNVCLILHTKYHERDTSVRYQAIRYKTEHFLCLKIFTWTPKKKNDYHCYVSQKTVKLTFG